jgi:hypothetical protein
MQVMLGLRAVSVGVLALGVLAACSQSTPQQATVPTTIAALATEAPTLGARFNATAAVGGGINASNAVSADDVASVLASVPGINQLKVTANSSPAGAKGADVTSVSVIAQDSGGLLGSLDQAGKRTLAEAILTAAATAWPKAGVSLLVTDPSGNGGQIIGSRSPGGPNTIIAS